VTDADNRPPTRRYVFLDEAGNFDFTGNPRASRYLILTSVTLDDLTVGDRLLALRRELAWSHELVLHGFHAAEDRQAVRDEVFRLLAQHAFRIDATVAFKSGVDAHLRQDRRRLYKVMLYKHLQRIAPEVVADGEVLVACAALGTRRDQEAHMLDLADVLRSVTPERPVRQVMWSASSEPCLQIADYCCWAIQRKWERADVRSYDLIKDKIVLETPLFAGEGADSSGGTEACGRPAIRRVRRKRPLASCRWPIQSFQVYTVYRHLSALTGACWCFFVHDGMCRAWRKECYELLRYVTGLPAKRSPPADRS
jgi:hypothetical protein